MTEAATPDLFAFADDEACAGAIGAMAAIDAELARIEAQKNEAVQAAAKAAEDKASPLLSRRAILARSVEAYCIEHRGRLTDGGKRKTAPFTTGECQWRMGRATVSIEEAEAYAIVKKLKRMGKAFLRFVKVTETPKKTALKDATEAEKARLKKIKGLDFVKGAEVFEVKPTALNLAERPPAPPVKPGDGPGQAG